MTANRITLVTLAVADVAASAAFYERLGWEIGARLETMAVFDMAGQKFALYDRRSLAADLGRALETLGTGAMTLAQNFPSEALVDTAFAAAIAAGGRVCRPPGKTGWGGYAGTWADPDGHVWEYAHNPFWPLDSEGRLR